MKRRLKLFFILLLVLSTNTFFAQEVSSGIEKAQEIALQKADKSVQKLKTNYDKKLAAEQSKFKHEQNKLEKRKKKIENLKKGIEEIDVKLNRLEANKQKLESKVNSSLVVDADLKKQHQIQVKLKKLDIVSQRLNLRKLVQQIELEQLNSLN